MTERLVGGLLLLAITALPSCSGTDPERPVLAEGSFTVTTSIEPVEPGATLDGQGCTAFDSTARLERNEEGDWGFVAAVKGEQDATKLEPSGSVYQAVAKIPSSDGLVSRANVLDLPLGGCCERLLITDLTFSPEVNANDGSLVGFSAVGAAALSTASCGGDTYAEVGVNVTLQGRPDRLSPEVVYPTHALHPFDAVELPFSEVVSGETQASLTDSTGTQLRLERRGALVAGGPFWAFRAEPLLSFGRSAVLDIDGADLAGNRLTVGGFIASVEDPGVLPADGFESDVTALTESRLRIVSEGAITGQHSLQIGDERGSTGRVTFHLRSNQPAKLVRLNAQSLGWFTTDGDVVGVRVEAAALDGKEIVSKELTLDFRPKDAKDGELPPVEALELELPELTKDAIVSFDMVPHEQGCGLDSCDEVPALIDDLRLE